MLDEFPSLGICLENMWEPDTEMPVGILEQATYPSLQAYFDCGHANVYSNHSLVSWIKYFNEYLTHKHWSDNEGDGSIEWEELVKAQEA